MKRICFELWMFGRKKWVKWTVAVVAVAGITAAHIVMSAKYGHTEKSPTAEFTLALHSALLLVAISGVLLYKKLIKRKLIEYGTKKDGNGNNENNGDNGNCGNNGKGR